MLDNTKSGTIQVENESQVVVAADPTCTWFFFENITDPKEGTTMWVGFNREAKAGEPGCKPVLPGDSFDTTQPDLCQNEITVVAPKRNIGFTVFRSVQPPT